MTSESFPELTRALSESWFVLDKAGTIRSANPAAGRLLGMDASALPGRKIGELVTDDAAKLTRYLTMWLRNGTALPGALVWRTSRGEEVPCRCFGNLLRPAEGEEQPRILLRCDQKAVASNSFILLNRKLDEAKRSYHQLAAQSELLKADIDERRRSQEALHVQALMLEQEIAERQMAQEALEQQTALLEEEIAERIRVEMEREQYFKFFQSSSDLMVIADAGGRIEKTNPACVEALGYAEAELIAKPFIDLVHPDDRQATLDEMARQLQLGHSFNFENRYLCKDGTTRWLSWRATYDKGERLSYASARDITEIKRVAEAMQKSERRKTIMDRISMIFHSVADEEVYSEVLKAVLEVMESRLGVFGYISDTGDLVVPSMTRGIWELCQIADKNVVFPRDTWGESLWGRALREKKALYANGNFRLPEGHIAIDNFLAVPIVFVDRAIGLLCVANKSGGYGDEDRELQEVIAARISPILNARQQRDLKEQERQRAEDELRQAMLYNRSLIEASMDPLVTISSLGTITDVNTATEKITGYSRTELIGTDFSEYFTDREKARAGYRLAFAQGMVHDYELDIRHRDGHFTPVLYSASVYRNREGEVIGVFAAARDMSARKLAEEELSKFSEAITQSPVSIVITDKNGTIEFVNPKFTKITGYSFEEARGQNPRILKSGSTAPEKYRHLWTTILSGDVWHGELHNKKKDGEPFIEYETISSIKNKEGEITHFLAIKEDISEKRALEAQLVEAQKMEAVGLLAGGVAHDFNNILTAIIGFGTILEMRMAADDPQRLNANQILVAAERAADLTRSLLTFSRKQVINPRPVHLKKVIERIVQFLKRVIGEDIDLATIFRREDLVINADGGQLEQVLMNLATNARDAMPNGGVLTIETDSIRMDNEFIKANGYGMQGDYAVISVTDTGIGMDEVSVKRIFEPFFTTKEAGKGTGLGLAVVYGIVKQHNGYINVYSEQGIGTTFNIYLPQIEMELDQNGNVTEEMPQRGVETVLVADDDESLRRFMDIILSQFGYTVLTATDGADAVRKFEENKDNISLVLIDIIMPKMNGKEALEEIQKIRPGVKSIFISGYTADILNKRGILNKELEFLTKPMRPAVLLKKVREILDREE
jgi:PAS domain S-box-containing protein